MKSDVNQLAPYFLKECEQQFKFLIDEYGFKIFKKEQTKFYDYILYRNNTTAIQISLEPRDAGIFVEIIRLIDNSIPERPTFITNETQLNRFDLEDFLSVIDSSIVLNIPSHIELLFSKTWKENIKSVLNQFAVSLKRYGQDVLKGNFSIFVKLEKIVKKRNNK